MPTELGRIRRNLVSRFAGDFVVRGMGALTYFVLARLLGTAGFGELMAALAFAGIFVVFHEAGFHFILTRETARHHSRAASYIRQVALLKGFVALAILALAPLLALLTGMGSGMAVLVAMAVLALNIASFVEMIGASMSGLERMDVEAGVRSVHKTLFFLLSLGGWFVVRQSWGVLAGQALASTVAVVVALWWAGRARLYASCGRGAGLWRGIRPWLREIWPLTAVALCVTVSARLDVVFLSRFRALVETGWYSAASRLLEFGQILPALLTGVLFPVLSRLAVSGDDSRRERTFGRLFRWFSALAVPLAILQYVWADVVVGVCYGPGYGDSASILRTLAPAMALSFMGYFFVYSLIASNRQDAYLFVTVVGCVVNVLANLWAVPRYGPEGAAWVRVTTEGVLFLGGLALFNAIVRPVHLGLLVRILVPAAVSIALAFAGRDSLLWGTLAALAYFPLLWLTRALVMDDVHFGARLVRSRR